MIPIRLFPFGRFFRFFLYIFVNLETTGGYSKMQNAKHHRNSPAEGSRRCWAARPGSASCMTPSQKGTVSPSPISTRQNRPRGAWAENKRYSQHVRDAETATTPYDNTVRHARRKRCVLQLSGTMYNGVSVNLLRVHKGVNYDVNIRCHYIPIVVEGILLLI